MIDLLHMVDLIKFKNFWRPKSPSKVLQVVEKNKRSLADISNEMKIYQKVKCVSKLDI